MDTASLAAGWLLPWLAGMAVLLAAPRRMHPLQLPGEIPWLFGAGFLVGAFVLTLWLRVLAAVGIAFGWIAVGAPIVLVGAVLGAFGWRRNDDAFLAALRAAARALFGPPQLSSAARLAWRVLLVWIVLRFVLLGLEVAWRPLYPWDAWTQWATKTRVWYELGRIVPFAGMDLWLADGSTTYFDASPRNPPTVPLLQVWSSIALGRWDDASMNWPWWMIAVALTLAVYGALRSLGTSELAALTGGYFVASLPLANVHVALAGYADLPMAAYYTVAVLAFLRWCETRSARDGGLALVMALACSQIALPGFAWALTLVPAALVVLLPRRGLRLVGLGLGIALFVLLALARTDFQFAGHRLHLAFAPEWESLGQSYFLLANWHLLWYGVLVAALLAWRELLAPPLAPLAAVVATAMFVLLAMSAFPEVRLWIAGQTSMNRATLHIVPLLIAFLVLAHRDFARRWAATPPEATPVPTAGAGAGPL